MKLNTFLGLVMVGAKELKNNSTKEQKDRINLETLNPFSSDSCLLGQMAGNSNSLKAINLVSKNIWLDTKSHFDYFFSYRNSTYHDISIIETFRSRQPESCPKPLAAFEWFLMIVGSNGSDLVKYVKGELHEFIPRIEVPVTA